MIAFTTLGLAPTLFPTCSPINSVFPASIWARSWPLFPATAVWSRENDGANCAIALPVPIAV